MHWDNIAYDKLIMLCIGITFLMISIVVQCIEIALHTISIVVQCNGIK